MPGPPDLEFEPVSRHRPRPVVEASAASPSEGKSSACRIGLTRQNILVSQVLWTASTRGFGLDAGVGPKALLVLL